jgi:hypothetical protein
MALCQHATGIREYVSKVSRFTIPSPADPFQSPAPSSPRQSIELYIKADDDSDVEIV